MGYEYVVRGVNLRQPVRVNALTPREAIAQVKDIEPLATDLVAVSVR